MAHPASRNLIRCRGYDPYHAPGSDDAPKSPNPVIGPSLHVSCRWTQWLGKRL